MFNFLRVWNINRRQYMTRVEVDSSDYQQIIEVLESYSELLVSRSSQKAVDTNPGRLALNLVQNLGYTNLKEFYRFHNLDRDQSWYFESSIDSD